MKEKTKFPFKPSEKIIMAFEYEQTLEVVTTNIMRALAQVMIDLKQKNDPFALFRKEYPEITEELKSSERLAFNSMTQMIDIK